MLLPLPTESRVDDVNGTLVILPDGQYDCLITNSENAVFSSDNGNALASSIIGILFVLATVGYTW